MTFKKGHTINKGKTPANKGRTKENYSPLKTLSEKLKDRHISPKTEFKPGMKIRKGQYHTNKTKLNLSQIRKGSIPWNKGLTKETDKRVDSYSKKLTGRKLTDTHKQNLSFIKKGKTNIKLSKFLKESYSNNLLVSIATRPEVKEKIKQARMKQVLPFKDTSIEVKIQNYLKLLGIDFITHQYIKDIKHSYQCDIFIPRLKLVIECDGNYWHKYPTGTDLDHIRTNELIEKGFKVVRLWENEIKILDLNNFKEVISKF